MNDSKTVRLAGRGRSRTRKAPAPSSEKLITELLDAAEACFAERGYSGTKLRAVAEAAGSNMGALYYYWSTKEKLFQAVCERRLLPVMRERTARLDELMLSADEGKLEIAEVLRAVVEPAVAQAERDEREGSRFGALFARTLVDPAAEVDKILHDIIDESLLRSARVLRLCCRHLDDETFHYRLLFVFSAMQSFQSHRDHVDRVAYGRFDDSDLRKGSAHLVQFLVAGLAAPMMKDSE